MKIAVAGLHAKVRAELVTEEVDLDIRLTMSPEEFDELDPEQLADDIAAAINGDDAVELEYDIDEIQNALPPEVGLAVATLKRWLGNNHPDGYLVIDNDPDAGLSVLVPGDEDEENSCCE